MRPIESVLSDKMRELLITVARHDRLLAETVGLNTSDLFCLSFVQSASTPVTPTQLSDYIGISTGATTALIDRLERRGLLRRSPHATDRRGIVLEIGDGFGSSGVPEMQQRYRQVMLDAWRTLTDAELAAVAHFLDVTSAEVSDAIAVQQAS